MRRVPVYSQVVSGVATHESGKCGVCGWNACHRTFRGSIGAVVVGGGRSSVPRGAPWFPRGDTDGANCDGVGDRSGHPVGCDIRDFEPGITQDEVIGSNVGDIKAKRVRLGSGHDCEVDIIAQVSSHVWGSIGVFDSAGGFHILDSQPIFINESLANEALVGSAVEEGLDGDLLLRRLQCNWYAHRIACRAGL